MESENRIIPYESTPKSIGFVKSQRSIMDGPIWNEDATRFKIWGAIYYKANYKPYTWEYKGEIYHCEPGQFVTSYQKLADLCKSKDITRKVVINTCKFLVKHEYITIESKYKSNIKITVIELYRAQFGAQFGAQIENPETPVTIEENEIELKERAQFGAQFGATNKEKNLKNVQEGGGAPKNTPPTQSHKKILKAYYLLYQKYTGKSKQTRFKQDSNILDKHQIPINDTDTVITTLTGWFEYADNGTIERLYPLPWFCSQYDEICNKLKDKIEAQREEDRREAQRIERQRKFNEEHDRKEAEKAAEDKRIASLTPEQRELEKIDNRIQTLNLFITGRQQANDTSLMDKVREYQSELKELERRRAELTRS